MKPLLITSGEPAGIGPDLCLALASATTLPIVVLCDKTVLAQRAAQLGQPVVLEDYQSGIAPSQQAHHLTILSQSCAEEVVAGKLNSKNATYVMQMLTSAVERCIEGEFSALITAPVNKAVINQAGTLFTGHTEFLADYCKVDTVVMMLASAIMKVALVTTHLPLRQVADTVTSSLIMQVVIQLHTALQRDFGITHPKIFIAGLNPHAGEGGYLGFEELEIITPAIKALKARGVDVHGPMPADTMFTVENTKRCDAFVAMYHDQGLPVIKYADFGRSVNVTLGLPIIRTSVDHGTALDLAGTGKASASSLLTAIEMAASMVKRRENHQ